MNPSSELLGDISLKTMYRVEWIDSYMKTPTTHYFTTHYFTAYELTLIAEFDQSPREFKVTTLAMETYFELMGYKNED